MAKYSITGYKFDLPAFFPMSIFDQITEARVERPGVIMEEAEARQRRPYLTEDGKLTILAADHPARMVTNFGADATAMGDRQQYLGRILRVVTSPGVDGVMGTTDVLEDLLIVNHLVKEAGGAGFLDGKVMLGCINRTGLAGAAWEMDDRPSSFTPDSIARLRLDGCKLMVRICLEEPELSNRTLTYCADAITDCNELAIPIFLEPLPVEHKDGKYSVKRNPVDLIKVIGVAAALGDSSWNLWLKIPYCDDYSRVARATTLPCLMLGGESKGDPTGILDQFAAGMQAGNNIRGALVGRNVTFCGDDDPLAVAQAVSGIIHADHSPAQAVKNLLAARNKNRDALTRWLS
jgi:DhnA family fructose-bisphosphate aldolase class Ia